MVVKSSRSYGKLGEFLLEKKKNLEENGVNLATFLKNEFKIGENSVTILPLSRIEHLCVPKFGRGILFQPALFFHEEYCCFSPRIMESPFSYIPYFSIGAFV